MPKAALISVRATPRLALGGSGCGGEHEYIRQLAQALAASGWQIDVFTAGSPPEACAIDQWSPQIRIITLPLDRRALDGRESSEATRRVADAITRLARREETGYDVVHAHGVASARVAHALVPTLPNAALVSCFADELPDVAEARTADPESDLTSLIVGTVAASEVLIARSPREREELIAQWGARRDRVRLIPCGVDVDRFRRVPRFHARAALGIPNDDIIVMHVGYLRDGHGVEDTLAALSALRYGMPGEELQQNPRLDARLIVVGGGTPEGDDERLESEAARLTRRSENLGVRDVLTFTGAKCGNVLRFYYSAADVVATTPRSPRPGISALEAMACGTPVLGTSVGGIAYVVADEETGALVRPSDPLTLATALLRLAESPDVRATMGARGRQRATSMFSWSEVGRSVAQLYSDISQQSRPIQQFRQSHTDTQPMPPTDGRPADSASLGA